MPPLALPDPPLSDGVVALRGFEPGDIDALVAALQDPEIPRWTLVPSPYGADDARDYMRYMNAGRAKGLRLSLAIVDAADQRVLLGSVALNPIDWEQGAADVGYWLAAHARGRGHATRAVELLAQWALATLGLQRLELRAQEANHASRAVAARAGFVPVAAPVVRRPECDDLPDVYFARVRG
ncbi:MAG TPA: GNAT family N-acetyltransferase [Solirubrobacteraceae bacterium]|nr:GNAT family N-acetyltransferase [Solirubrobacteraceae bacterium]